MNPRVSEYLRKLQLMLILLFGTMPLTLLLFEAAAPAFLSLAWVLPAVCLALCLVILALRGKARVAVMLISCAMAAAAAGLLIYHTGCWFLVLAGLLYVVLLWSAAYIAGLAQEEELPSVILWLCIAVALCAQLVKAIISSLAEADFQRLNPWLILSFLGFLLPAILSMNRSSLLRASAGAQQVSRPVRRRNLVHAVILFVLITAISLSPHVVRAGRRFFLWLWESVKVALAAVIRFYDSLFPDVPPSGQTPADPPAAGLPQVESGVSPFAGVLEVVVKALFFVVIAAGAIVVLVVLFRLLRKLFRLVQKLIRKFVQVVPPANDDYVDEVTDLKKSSQGESPLSRLLKHRLPPVDESRLSPGELVRRYYLKLMIRHPDWAPGTTAREKLPDADAALYEQARYSSHEIDPGQAKEFASRTGKM